MPNDLHMGSYAKATFDDWTSTSFEDLDDCDAVDDEGYVPKTDMLAPRVIPKPSALFVHIVYNLDGDVGFSYLYNSRRACEAFISEGHYLVFSPRNRLPLGGAKP